MTKEETIKIMAMLGAFYGGGKSNPEVMATAWHLILSKYEYRVASRAVLDFAENDTRQYATFPAVGCIVQAIRDAMQKEEAPVKEIIRAVSYGWHYDQLSDGAKALIREPNYNDWLKMDAEEFNEKAGVMAGTLKRSQKRLQGVTL